MPTQTFAALNRERRTVSTANTGLAATTTVNTVGLLPNTDNVSIHAQTFTTAVGMQFAVNPFLVVVKTDDGGATFTDYSENAQDNDATTDVTLSSLGTLANLDAVFVGSHTPFRGIDIDVDAANATASVLTVNYFSGTTWADISDTDNTDSGGASMAQDGTVVWTVPTDWEQIALNKVIQVNPDPFQATAVALANYGSLSLYWTRWEWSVALDSSTTQNSWHALNRSTAYSELSANQTYEQSAKYGSGGFGSVEVITTVGTAFAQINVGSGNNTFRP